MTGFVTFTKSKDGKPITLSVSSITQIEPDSKSTGTRLAARPNSVYVVTEPYEEVLTSIENQHNSRSA